MKCDFCKEIAGIETIYNSVYGDLNRLILSTDSFAVLPCMGQLREGHLLIISKEHLNSIGAIDVTQYEELESTISSVVTALRKIYSKDVICFEHGVLCDDGMNGGCGIYHMHIHLLPIDYEEFSNILMTVQSEQSNRIYRIQRLADLRGFVEKKLTYTMVSYCESHINKMYAVLSNKNYFESQYMRKVICKIINKSQWDWRKTLYVESDFLNTLNSLKRYFNSTGQ